MNKVYTNILFAALLLFASSSLIAQDKKISIQGILKDANGAAVPDGDYDLTFKMYTVTTGGTEVWMETQSDVPVRGGVYSALMGSVTNFNGVAFDVPYFLGVSVNGGTELTPRTELSYAPYALAVDQAQKVEGGATGNKFATSGNVGIGTNNPTQGKLHIEGASDNGILIKGVTPTVNFENTNGSKRSRVGMATGNNHISSGSTSGDLVMLAPAGNEILFSQNADVKMEIGDVVKIPIDEMPSNGGALQIGPDDANHIVIGNRNIQSYGGSGNPETLRFNQLGGSVTMGDFAADGANFVLIYDHFQVRNSRNVSVGEFTPEDSSAPYNYGHLHSTGVTSQADADGVFGAVSILATQNILAQRFWAFSDERIKKNVNPMSRVESLEKIRNLEVVNYDNVDQQNDGYGRRRGFIAQAVKEIMPEAVRIEKKVIPNIYARPLSTRRDGAQVVFSMKREHNLKPGDYVNLIDRVAENLLEVSECPDSKSFAVHGYQGDPEEVFVYGQEVEDYHVLDYDMVYTTTVSAVQDLILQIDGLRKSHDELSAVVARQQESLEKLMQQVGGINDTPDVLGDKSRGSSSFKQE